MRIALAIAGLLAATPRVLSVPEPYRAEVESPPQWSREAAALGKKLFHDPLLSRDQTVSCASCHRPELAFTDGRRVGKGIDGHEGARNTPTVVNRAVGRIQFWDGRAATLEDQALGPMANAIEMDLSPDEAVTRIARNKQYRARFRQAFGGPPTKERLARALAAYERSVYSVKSPFDRYVEGDASALSASARRGLDLFGKKARCGECHLGPNLSDEEFHVLGVSTDDGRANVTGDPAHRGAFKTPTLREIARTAPYMHDGSLATLAEVVDYYDRGGRPHPNLDPKIAPLKLTPQEKADLVAFLEALSGTVVDFEGPVQ